jgi:hypothetical protein
MSTRKLTTNEIQAVAAILNDKDAIEILKQINNNIVTEEDTKGKRKQNDIFAFVGFAHQDDVLGEDAESEEYKNKAGSLKKLVDAGLILEGAHIPLERKNEDKYGDQRFPSATEKVGKYKLTEEGLTVLALATQKQLEEGAAAAAVKQTESKPPSAATAATTKTNTTKKHQIEQFKTNVKKEDNNIKK